MCCTTESADSKVAKKPAKKTVEIYCTISDFHKHYDICNVYADKDWDPFHNKNIVLLLFQI